MRSKSYSSGLSVQSSQSHSHGELGVYIVDRVCSESERSCSMSPAAAARSKEV